MARCFAKTCLVLFPIYGYVTVERQDSKKANDFNLFKKAARTMFCLSQQLIFNIRLTQEMTIFHFKKSHFGFYFLSPLTAPCVNPLSLLASSFFLQVVWQLICHLTAVWGKKCQKHEQNIPFSFHAALFFLTSCFQYSFFFFRDTTPVITWIVQFWSGIFFFF